MARKKFICNEITVQLRTDYELFMTTENHKYTYQLANIYNDSTVEVNGTTYDNDKFHEIFTRNIV